MYADTREFTDYWLRTPDLDQNTIELAFTYVKKYNFHHSGPFLTKRCTVRLKKLRTPDLEGGHKVGADDSLDLSQLCRAKSRMDDNQSRNF